jgi:hypothetical protein
MRDRVLLDKGPVIETWQPLIGLVVMIALVALAIQC